MVAINEQSVFWKPNKGPQNDFLACADLECLFGGAAGGGKSDGLLAAAARFTNEPDHTAILFRKTYKRLRPLIERSHGLYPKMGGTYKASEYEWKFPSGATILFRYLDKYTDVLEYQGDAFTFIGWDELTQWADDRAFVYMLSRLRAVVGSNCVLMVRATCNPGGPGHNWVKRRYAIPGDGTASHTRDSGTGHRIRFIPSRIADNPFLAGTNYERQLDALPEKERKALKQGRWDVVAGGALDDVWKQSVHVVQRFEIPKGWRIDRAFDWGSSHPFAVGWFAVANGEEITFPAEPPFLPARKFCPAKGSLIMLAEWYGSEDVGTNTGLKLSAQEIAEGIKNREEKLLEEGWIPVKPSPGPADNQINDVREKDVESIASKMAKEGIRWEKSDKSKGSRTNGLQLVRDRLHASIKGEGEGLYFMENCVATAETLPVLPRDEKNPDDVDTDAEDHLYDVVRYRSLAAPAKFFTVKAKVAR